MSEFPRNANESRLLGRPLTGCSPAIHFKRLFRADDAQCARSAALHFGPRMGFFPEPAVNRVAIQVAPISGGGMMRNRLEVVFDQAADALLDRIAENPVAEKNPLADNQRFFGFERVCHT